jgi:hypothetical protein
MITIKLRLSTQFNWLKGRQIPYEHHMKENSTTACIWISWCCDIIRTLTCCHIQNRRDSILFWASYERKFLHHLHLSIIRFWYYQNTDLWTCKKIKNRTDSILFWASYERNSSTVCIWAWGCDTCIIRTLTCGHVKYRTLLCHKNVTNIIESTCVNSFCFAKTYI